MKIKFYTVDAFTDTAFQGTPVLVFPAADNISDELMLKLSLEFGFPDTVFVTKASNKNYAAKFRLFTRSGETTFEGHATIGAAYALFKNNALTHIKDPQKFTIEEKLGPIDIIITEVKDDQWKTEFVVQTQPAFDTYVPSNSELAKILSLDSSSLNLDSFEPMVTRCDRSYLIVPIANSTDLQKAQFSNSAWVSSTSTSTLPRDLLLFAPASDAGETHFQARLLGESISSNEDPPIGSSMPAFASYLGQSGQNNKAFTIERGVGYSRLSTLNVHVDSFEDTRATIRVGGSVVCVSEGEVEI